MNDREPPRHLFDHPRNVRRLVRLLVAVGVVLFGLDAVIHRHAEHPWESVFGFYAGYGFVACVLLVLLAREMRRLLMRREDYYGEGPPTQQAPDRGRSGD
ncbi:hypothetical protein [Motiliproteus sp. SC1-56]|uniref:hypothetical protein n=1 Tax=Motiliproteus sp. SC1-56 TaxID=2799565 RepID=UPI001A8FAF65|nr:hypothetical protein [Motiliproteus sp. SC1-56]